MLFHPCCYLTLSIPSLTTLAMQTPLLPNTCFIAMFLCHPYDLCLWHCSFFSSSYGGEFSESSGLLVLVGFIKMMYGIFVCRRVYTYVLIYVCFRRGPPVQNHPKMLTSQNQHVIDGFLKGLEGMRSGGPWLQGWTHAAGFCITASVCLKVKPTNLRWAPALSNLLYKPIPSRDNCAQMSWKHDSDIYLFTSSLYLDFRDFLASHNHISI